MTIAEIISGLSENASVEELRRALADISDANVTVLDDITSLNSVIEDLQNENRNLTDEVSRLKEENGRLFRERVTVVADATNKELESVSSVDEIEKLENEIEIY